MNKQTVVLRLLARAEKCVYRGRRECQRVANQGDLKSLLLNDCSHFQQCQLKNQEKNKYPLVVEMVVG